MAQWQRTIFVGAVGSRKVFVVRPPYQSYPQKDLQAQPAGRSAVLQQPNFETTKPPAALADGCRLRYQTLRLALDRRLTETAPTTSGAGLKKTIQLAFGAAMLSLSAQTVAQTRAQGFAINRYDPSEAGSHWFANEALDFRGHQRFAAQWLVDYNINPLLIYNDDGTRESAVIGHQLISHLGGAVTLWERFRLALNLPMVLTQDGEGGPSGNENFKLDGSTALGDIRLSTDLQLAGRFGGPARLAAGFSVYFPTGSEGAYTSDEMPRFAPRLMLAGDSRAFTYAAKIGMMFRDAGGTFGQSPVGSELLFSAAAGIRAAGGQLVIGPELWGSTVFTEADAFFRRRTTPLELLFGSNYQSTKGLNLGAGLGPGLSRGFGTPELRILARLGYTEPLAKPPARQPTPPKPADRDGDGIVDNADACPDLAGQSYPEPQRNGCPAPGDRDKDGIVDNSDACPDRAGVPKEDPERNGCPIADRDKDGIVDASDACPDEPGLTHENPQKNGCPTPEDRDSDNIPDTQDACPDAAGAPNNDAKKHGCPVARVDQGQIRIREQVQFASGSGRLLATSDPVLDAVRKILSAHPEITKIEVQGHTDSKGSDHYNLRLSNRRAAAVVRWLTQAGISAARLSSRGLGEERPIDTNETAEGRANNRRVEFHIVRQQAAEKKPSR